MVVLGCGFHYLSYDTICSIILLWILNDHQGSAHQITGSGRVRRDAAARAMQGWHAQRFYGIGEAGEQSTKVCQEI